MMELLLLVVPACDSVSTSGYNIARGYDKDTLKLIFSTESGKCLNRFTFDSKLAPDRPAVVPCDGPDARIRNDGSHANSPGCVRLDYESISKDGREFFCVKYLTRVGYCYPGVTPPHEATSMLLYAPSSCVEDRRLPLVATNLVPDVAPDPPFDEVSRFVVTDIWSPAQGKHCPGLSVDLEPPEQIAGPHIPPAVGQLICLQRH
jgi:hypothetical protein